MRLETLLPSMVAHRIQFLHMTPSEALADALKTWREREIAEALARQTVADYLHNVGPFDQVDEGGEA